MTGDNVQTWDECADLPWLSASPPPLPAPTTVPVRRRRLDTRTLADVVLAVAGDGACLQESVGS